VNLFFNDISKFKIIIFYNIFLSLDFDTQPFRKAKAPIHFGLTGLPRAASLSFAHRGMSGISFQKADLPP
jgi:hypothetical protein